MNKEILSVYRRILRVARSWKASSGRAEDTLEERKYIANECRELFRQNSKVFCCFILHVGLRGRILTGLIKFVLKYSIITVIVYI